MSANGRQWTAWICAAGAIAGGLLAVAGGAWVTFGGGELVYSEQQAKEYEAAGAAWHTATIGRGPAAAESDAHSTGRAAAVAAARERFARAEADLQRARFAQNDLGPWMVGIGFICAAAFGVAYLTVRRDNG